MNLEEVDCAKPLLCALVALGSTRREKNLLPYKTSVWDNPLRVCLGYHPIGPEKDHTSGSSIKLFRLVYER